MRNKGSMRKSDMISSGCLLIVSALICIGSVRLSLGSLKTPGPGFMSFLGGLSLGILGIAIFVEAWLKQPSEGRRFWGSYRGRLNVVLILACLCIYVVLLNYSGFILTTAVFMAFLFWVIGNEKWTTVILGAGLSTLGTYILFGWWLKLPLPKGFFGL
jgi:putative tricarboxylic transport membrane protein